MEKQSELIAIAINRQQNKQKKKMREMVLTFKLERTNIIYRVSGYIPRVKHLDFGVPVSRTIHPIYTCIKPSCYLTK